MALKSVETSVTIYQSTRLNIPDDVNIKQHRCDNLISQFRVGDYNQCSVTVWHDYACVSLVSRFAATGRGRTLCCVFFFSVAQQANWGLGRLILLVPRSHTHTRWDSSERAISSSQGPLPTQQKQETNIYALSGTWTRDLRSQAVADRQLRPHDHCDRRLTHFGTDAFDAKELANHICIMRSFPARQSFTNISAALVRD
jgi:hypothetical protein